MSGFFDGLKAFCCKVLEKMDPVKVGKSVAGAVKDANNPPNVNENEIEEGKKHREVGTGTGNSRLVDNAKDIDDYQDR